MKQELCIQANRNQHKYGSSENWRRVLWFVSSLLFKFSPRPFFAWRCWLLRRFGAEVGCGVHIYSSAFIYFPWNLKIGDWSSIGENALIYNLGQITIGASVTISQRAHLCAGTHDYTKPDMPLLKPPISIGDQVWVCADAFIGPGIRIGEGVVVGARSVVVKDVEPWSVVVGNPAKFIKKRILLPSGQ